MDFTLTTYQKLLQSLLKQGFTFQPFAEHIECPEAKAVILRHDVDKLPGNSLQTAQLEHSLGIQGSYYFRVVKESWDEGIIRQVAAMGHEIGYHYEDLSLCRGDHGEAIRHFEEQLKRFREIVDVKTICMHGSPLSKYDNRDLWKDYDYRDYGILGEPYFDLDFSRVFYLTDTGRRWDGHQFSVRDKIITHGHPTTQTRDNPHGQTPDNPPVETQGRASLHYRGPASMHYPGRTFVKRPHDQKYKSTRDIITAINNNTLPYPLMVTIHPQRWTNKPLPWLHELLWQNTKNIIKKQIVRLQQRQNHK